MTAAELVAYLTAHPMVCERLGITCWTRQGVRFVTDDEGHIDLAETDSQIDANLFLRWLLGAFSEWADEVGIDVVQSVRQRGGVPQRSDTQFVWRALGTVDDTPHASRLHAYVAAMEARP